MLSSGKWHDEAALGAEVAERVQAAREIAVGARRASDRAADLSHARHDAHVEHDVGAVGDLDADLRDARSGGPIRNGTTYIVRPFIAPSNSGVSLRAGVVGRHPVVGRARRPACRCVQMKVRCSVRATSCEALRCR